MARAVENETPGLFHRHALNYLITTRSWSPPRQALIWAALDIAIASALQAAWYYKWLSPRPLTSRRQRPIEYATDNGIDLSVLFDRPDELNPMYITCPDARPCAPNPGFSPGTPRHPAYPSGHSTYSGAATTILAYFFGNDPTPNALTLGLGTSTIGDELRNVADNIGMGRMWAGIHWRSDHEAGLKLGQVVACLVLRQLSSICGCRFDLCPPMMPMPAQCKCSDADMCPDDSPPPCDELKSLAWACHWCFARAPANACPPSGIRPEISQDRPKDLTRPEWERGYPDEVLKRYQRAQRRAPGRPGMLDSARLQLGIESFRSNRGDRSQRFIHAGSVTQCEQPRPPVASQSPVRYRGERTDRSVCRRRGR